jgi:hypothetical protein
LEAEKLSGRNLVSVIVKTDLTEDEAYAAEKLLVTQYGRKNNGTGCLLNHSSGGAGVKSKPPATRKGAWPTLSIRTAKATAEALGQAAQDELRPMSAQAEMILREWLKAKGYIQ